MKKILTTKKVTAATLLLGCLSGPALVNQEGRNSAAVTKMQQGDPADIMVSAGNQQGELLIQVSGDAKKIFYILVANISGRIVAKRIIYAARLWRISGLTKGLYRYSVYSNRREVCTGEIRTC